MKERTTINIMKDTKRKLKIAQIKGNYGSYDDIILDKLKNG